MFDDDKRAPFFDGVQQLAGDAPFFQAHATRRLIQQQQLRFRRQSHCADRGKVLAQRLNSLALSQESHIAESYGNNATAELKRLLENLIEKAN